MFGRCCTALITGEIAGMDPLSSRRYELGSEARRLRSGLVTASATVKSEFLRRIPVRSDDGLVLVPTARVVTIEAERERLIITTIDQDRHTILCRLKNLEQRLDPADFVRLSRSLIVNINVIVRIVTLRGWTSTAILDNGQRLGMSRKQTVRLRRVLHGLLG